MIYCLVEGKVDPCVKTDDKEKHTSLHLACNHTNWNKDVVKKLIDVGSGKNILEIPNGLKKETVLAVACQKNQQGLVSLLLECKADANTTNGNDCAILETVILQKLDVIAELLLKHADAKLECNRNCLPILCSRDILKMNLIRKLISGGSNVEIV